LLTSCNTGTTANFLPSATEGLGATPGRELLIADAPAGFARAVVALLRDPARRAALGQAARQFVAARFDWATIVPGLEAVYGGEAAPKTL